MRDKFHKVHNIKFTRFECTIQLLWTNLIALWNSLHNPILKHIYHHQICCHFQSYFQPQTTTHLLSASINLPFWTFPLNISYVVFCVWLLFLSMMFSWFVYIVTFLYCWILSHCMDIPHFHSSANGCWSCDQFCWL